MEKYSCIKCLEPITNPICDECFLDQVRNWIKEKPILEKRQKQLMKKIRNSMILDSPCEISCILCNNNYVSICSYCFFLSLSKILIKEGVSREMVDEFLEIFNYREPFEEDNYEP